MEKYQRDIDTLTEAIDAIIERHPDESKLVISCTICIMGKGHEVNTCQIMQFGIRDALCLLLRESLEHTENESEEFIGNKVSSFTINFIN